MYLIKKIIFVYFVSRILKYDKNLSFVDLNFKEIDFTNYGQIKNFIFKKNFYNLNNKYVQNFDFLNYSKNLGGKIGIGLSKKNIFKWYSKNKRKIGHPWIDDLTSKRFINIMYNYEFVNSSSNKSETKLLNKIISFHIHRIFFDFKNRQVKDLTSYDLVAFILSSFVSNKFTDRCNDLIHKVTNDQVDKLGMHKSYNILEHAKFINNLHEIKNMYLFYKYEIPKIMEETILKMTSILKEYFHKDGSIALFNGSNNNYTNKINNFLKKEEYFKNRSFSNTNNGIAFYSDKEKKLFFDVVQPNKDSISNQLSAGTLSIEFSCKGEKILTNCGASESLGKNPEYLRYSAAHSTIIIQNTNISEIKENNPHIKFPQSVSFNSIIEKNTSVFEGSHNGYQARFDKIIKRKIIVEKNKNLISGEDSIIPLRGNKNRLIYHIRFHLVDGVSFNFTNNKKNIILKTKLNNMWLFKSDAELIVEDSLLVDNNLTIQTQQIVIKGIIINNKIVKKWSLEKI